MDNMRIIRSEVIFIAWMLWAIFQQLTGHPGWAQFDELMAVVIPLGYALAEWRAGK